MVNGTPGKWGVIATFVEMVVIMVFLDKQEGDLGF